MPTDAELRTLFRDAPAPEVQIDTAAVIRRSRRRRIPQQLGAGSVLTLAVAGIGVAGVSGLQAIAPRTASDLAGDAPTSVSESAPFGGADSRDDGPLCTPEVPESAAVPENAEITEGVTVQTRFAATASPGETVTGSLILTNTSGTDFSGTVIDARVALALGGEQAWYTDRSLPGTTVELAPGGVAALDFTFAAIDCTDDTPLDAGAYDVLALLRLQDDGAVTPARGWQDDDAIEVVGGPASVITIR